VTQETATSTALNIDDPRRPKIVHLSPN